MTFLDNNKVLKTCGKIGGLGLGLTAGAFVGCEAHEIMHNLLKHPSSSLFLDKLVKDLSSQDLKHLADATGLVAGLVAYRLGRDLGEIAGTATGLAALLSGYALTKAKDGALFLYSRINKKNPQ